MYFLVERVDGNPFFLYEAVFVFWELGINAHGVYDDYNDKFSKRIPKKHDSQTYRIDLFLTPYVDQNVDETKIDQAVNKMLELGYKMTKILEDESKY